MATKDLETLACILADWSSPASGATIYLYGSRVRGDHKPTSDVDVCFDWGAVGEGDLGWWTANNETDFQEINTQLPGRLQILEMNDPLRIKIMSAPVVHQERNVRCVFLPPKPHSGT